MFTLVIYSKVDSCPEKVRFERFSTRADAERYALSCAAYGVEHGIRHHIYLAGDSFFQVDVDKTVAGWVGYQSDIHGIHRVA